MKLPPEARPLLKRPLQRILHREETVVHAVEHVAELSSLRVVQCERERAGELG